MTAMADGAGQRASAEGGAVHAGVNGARGLFGAEHCAQRNAAGKRLGQRDDVGSDAVVLKGAPLAGAAHAGLNLIDDEQCTGGAGECACLGEELLRERANAAFALNGFNEDGADVVGELGAQVGDVVEANELDAGNDGSEGLAVLRLVGCRDGAEGAAVEALLERKKLGADGLAFAAQQAGMGAGEFQRAFPGFGAGVGKEDAVEAGTLGETQSELGLALVIEEVRRVNELAALLGDGLFNRRMPVAERVDADAAEQVEVLRTVLVDEVDTPSPPRREWDSGRRSGAAGALRRREFDRV